MFKKIFVGNLSYQTSEDELMELFSQHGDVQSVKIIFDRETGRSRGFAFVEMDETAAGDAIQAVNGYEFQGRSLRVNEANERPAPGGNRGGNGGGGYGGGGNRGGGNRGGGRSFGGGRGRDRSDSYDDGY